MAHRNSSYSMASSAAPGPAYSSAMQHPTQSAQVSTTTLLNALHSAYASGQAYELESSASLVVNTWATAARLGLDGRYGGTVDGELARRTWEHARRRAEDGCIILGSLHNSAPSLFSPFVSALPLQVPGTFYTAINALKPFLHCVTPFNPSLPRYTALAGTFTLALTGEITGAALSLSTAGIDTQNGLLNIPAERGYRAFDVFYYLLTAQSDQERDFLGLKQPQEYVLLRRSETYDMPAYLPTSDDAAAAEDFRESLKAIGITGSSLRGLLSAVSALLRLGDSLGFLVDEEELEQTCEEVAGLIDLDPEVLLKKCATEDREVLIAGIYEALVDWVIMQANETIRNEIRTGRAIGSSSGSENGVGTPAGSLEEGDSVSITVIEVPHQALGKAASLKTVFDDSNGINAEMKDDGVPIVPAGSSVIREMKDAVQQSGADLDIDGSAQTQERELAFDQRQRVLEKVGIETEDESFLRQILYPIDGQGIDIGKTGRFVLSNVMGSSRVWFQLCLHPNEESPANFANRSPSNLPWSAGSVSSQIRSWRLPEWANYRSKQLDFTADFDVEEFVQRYRRLGCRDGKDGVESWILERGWSNGEVVVGHERIWMREAAYSEAESMLDMKPADAMSPSMMGGMIGAAGVEGDYAAQVPGGLDPGFYSDNPVHSRQASHAAPSRLGARSIAPTMAHTVRSTGGDYGLGFKGDDKRNYVGFEGEIDGEMADGKDLIVQKVTAGRRAWVVLVWVLTFWVPSPLMKWIGRMKRHDVRMAWREKLALMILIAILNGTVVFYIVGFGNLLCPNKNHVWNTKQVGYHQGTNDFYVSHMGKVYDLSKFYKLDHSDITSQPVTSDAMLEFAGTDVTPYILPPLTKACPGFGIGDTITLLNNNTLSATNAEHLSGPQLQTTRSSALYSINWYWDTFQPKMKEFYKGKLVYKRSTIKSDGQDNSHMWFIVNNEIFDLTDYFYTKKTQNNLAAYSFLPDDVEELVQSNPGMDISDKWENDLNLTTRTNTLNCLRNRFFIGTPDFRDTARCQVNNYILLAFTIILCAVILIKFLAALQLGGKKKPTQQDKFVICQVPAYTEGEDSLRKGLDSLTALQYDNKRKLICVICDGMIVGGGNDRPTPKIVLDILGVDPKIDPPALPFRSLGLGGEQLNYGKVYSGLYEYEGNVVPYLVVVKVGKESEQNMSKPGNRGKRDSQILLMSFLNRVHHRSAMNPLELEMYHQIHNIIGVDPELYEYLFMVDADTKVKEDSLNRLVASCANDAKIAGICGETSLENEERSWTTMIQVYEYYISHHLAKAFESLFGSVTCLPGCFCMYRLRTADKGRPLIISDKIVNDYSDNHIDTLHKKNLLSLGEDRYLTTLMLKHFPAMTYKFLPDAYALTEAPSQWSVLLSQRRRWINSTIHNLAEMLTVDLCGFCCFSMRFVVLIDLFGTIILPATFCYLVYLVVSVANGGQFPLISIIMLAAVYGLQAVIFLIKRQWQHIGWMLIYIMAYPIWSLILPVYSFWKQDDFSWGNTRVVIGEKGAKKLIAVDDEGYDPRSIPLQRWDDYALANNLPGRRGPLQEKDSMYQDGGYEMDDIQDMRSVYSSVPASTILTGFPQNQSFRPPQSPGPFNAYNRQSSYSRMSRYTDNLQQPEQQQRLMSMGAMSDHYSGHQSPYMQNQSQDNLMGGLPSPHMQQRTRSPLGGGFGGPSRPASTNQLSGFQTQGVSNEAITMAIRECLGEVDLDSVTKKQLKALTEQKLQCQLVGDKRAFLDAQIDFELANM